MLYKFNILFLLSYLNYKILSIGSLSSSSTVQHTINNSSTCIQRWGNALRNIARYVIKTSGSESRGQEEAACMRVLGLCDHYSELFTRMEALIFKMLWLSRYYSYRLVYYRPSTSYRVEPTYEESVKLAQPFLKNQPVREF